MSSGKLLNKDQKIHLLRDEFRRMDLNGDNAIMYDELLLHLNRQNVSRLNIIRK